MSINKRVAAIFKYYRCKQKDIAEKWAVKPQYVSGIVNEKNSVGLDVVRKVIVLFPEVNHRWLILGEGEMFDKAPEYDVVEEPKAAYGQNKTVETLQKVLDDLIKDKEYLRQDNERLKREIDSLKKK